MLNKFFTKEQGASSVEYAIIASLIAAVIVFIVTDVGVKVYNLFQAVASGNW